MVGYAAAMFLLLSLAAISTRRAQLLRQRLAERPERVWRVMAHAFWFTAISPLPVYFTLEIDQLTLLLQQLVGTALAGALICAALRLFGGLKLKSLFMRELSFFNETLLAVLGAVGSFLLAAVWHILQQPALRKEFLKAISGSK